MVCDPLIIVFDERMEAYSSGVLKAILFHSEVLRHTRVDGGSSSTNQIPEIFFIPHYRQLRR
jgi:hypothetical protein